MNIRKVKAWHCTPAGQFPTITSTETWLTWEQFLSQDEICRRWARTTGLIATVITSTVAGLSVVQIRTPGEMRENELGVYMNANLSEPARAGDRFLVNELGQAREGNTKVEGR